MKKILRSLVFGSMVALVGCAPTQLRSSRFDALQPGTGLAIFRVNADAPAQTIYDLSKSPKIVVATTVLRNGVVESAEFVVKKFSGDIVNGFAYVILPVSKQGERYLPVAYKLNGSGVSSEFSIVCWRYESPTFVMKEGEVAYVGDYSISPMRRGFEHSFNRDTKRATEDILRMYPELSARLHEADLTSMRTGYFGNSDCY